MLISIMKANLNIQTKIKKWNRNTKFTQGFQEQELNTKEVSYLPKLLLIVN